MMRIFLSVLLFVLVSCHSHSKKEAEKKFDTALLKQNEKFRLGGEYDSLINLNKRYYKQADKMNYEDGKALCYINLAELNISLENFQKSQILFDNAKEILDGSEDNLHKARSYNVYGRVKIESRRRDKACRPWPSARSSMIRLPRALGRREAGRCWSCRWSD